MDDKELSAGLRSLDVAHPFIRSLEELLRRGKSSETDACCQPSLEDGDRHFNAGRLAHACDVAEEIRGAIEIAHSEKQDEA